jgi:hypothetical protein
MERRVRHLFHQRYMRDPGIPLKSALGAGFGPSIANAVAIETRVELTRVTKTISNWGLHEQPF